MPNLKACAYCGKIFRFKNPRQLYCSASHKTLARLVLHRAEVNARYTQRRRIDIDKSRLRDLLKHVRLRAGLAMPSWVDPEEIKQVYANRPKDKVVDHIVPLADPKLGFNYYEGYPVSGLHVPWNLQIITQLENFLKTDDIQKRKRGFQLGWRNR